jgi:dienelactone hydrolase
MTGLAITLAVLAATPMSVDVRSADGFVLKGSYFSPGKGGPAIVLYHQCDSDRHVWDRLATDLAHAGFHVLTFDSRGVGESQGGGRPTKEKFSSDVDAAYNWLAAQPTVDKQKIAAGGGSCGVEAASTVAVMHHEVRILLLLSGGVPYRATKYLATASDVAIFAASAQRDPGAGNAVEVARASRNPHSVAKEYADAAHAGRLFTAHSELEPAIVAWLRTVTLDPPS